MPKLPIPRGWNERVQSAILQAISLGCFLSVVGRMANSPIAVDRIASENEHLKHERLGGRERSVDGLLRPSAPPCKAADAA